MKNEKKEDCYWFMIKENDGNKYVKPICVECVEKDKELKEKKGWFWEGSKLGYGNYNLNCFVCNKIINEKGENE